MMPCKGRRFHGKPWSHRGLGGKDLLSLEPSHPLKVELLPVLREISRGFG